MFRGNLRPSPFYTCGSIESNDHYLVYSQNYNKIRTCIVLQLANFQIQLMTAYYSLGPPISAIMIINTFFIWFNNSSSIAKDFRILSVTLTFFFYLMIFSQNVKIHVTYIYISIFYMCSLKNYFVLNILYYFLQYYMHIYAGEISSLVNIAYIIPTL